MSDDIELARLGVGPLHAASSYRKKEAHAAIDRLEALVAERDALAARLAEAERWYLDNFASDEDEPPADTLTVAQMIERVFQWGNGAWGTAGQESMRAEAAEARVAALTEALLAEFDVLRERR